MKRIIILLIGIILILSACSSSVDHNKIGFPKQAEVNINSQTEDTSVEGIVTNVIVQGTGGQFIISGTTGVYLIMNLPGVPVKEGDRVRVYGTYSESFSSLRQINAITIEIR